MTSPSPPERPAPGWKVLLALLSLALTALLWVDGLVGSLERPSVVDALGLRQLELAVLAEESLPDPLHDLVAGRDPRGALAGELRRQIEAASTPVPAQRRLELALLERGSSDLRTSSDAESQLADLVETVDAPRRPLVQALQLGETLPQARQAELLARWTPSTLLSQLSCEQLPGAGPCPATLQAAALRGKLLGVTVAPALFLLLGALLLLQQLWQWRRGRLPAAAPLIGPRLTPVDATLLIAGGFVLVGEVITPQLLQGPLQLGLAGLTPSLAQGLQVLLLYLGLMVAPLALLALQLRGLGTPPSGGWLQWRWRPPLPVLLQALRMVLTVLPLVALCGWLVDWLWSDPGGSNPLLELVLTSGDGLALLCFGLTAMGLAPLFEEMLFRGVLLPVVATRAGGPVAVVISAAVFALAHLSLSELTPLFVLGLGLGWLRWRSGRLAATVLMHALWNGLTFLNLWLLAD
ncbi:MAG: CPBP family intramembrane glutamic endopeptidase [Synechococcaceae cyanobacterium]|nr:CPBP family intramembrane glutamic endopeptidase [Synechococcaceae cyanobacterium]